MTDTEVRYVRAPYGNFHIVHAIVQADGYVHARCNSFLRQYLFTPATRAEVERNGSRICKRCERLTAADAARCIN